MESLEKNQDVLNYDGYKIAQMFLFYRRKLNPYIKKHLPLKLISAKKIYSKHKDKFDKFAIKVNSNNFDVDSYIKFCVITSGMTEDTLDLCISSTLMLNKYNDHLIRIAKYKKIYKWFMKSAKNIAFESIKFGFFSAKDFLRHLIETNSIGTYIASGKISLYYFAAMPNFEKIIQKLDYFSKKELSFLEKHFDIYHSDVNQAFIYVKNHMVNAIDITDAIMFKLRQKSKI